MLTVERVMTRGSLGGSVRRVECGVHPFHRTTPEVNFSVNRM